MDTGHRPPAVISYDLAGRFVAPPSLLWWPLVLGADLARCCWRIPRACEVCCEPIALSLRFRCFRPFCICLVDLREIFMSFECSASHKNAFVCLAMLFNNSSFLDNKLISLISQFASVLYFQF